MAYGVAVGANSALDYVSLVPLRYRDSIELDALLRLVNDPVVTFATAIAVVWFCDPKQFFFATPPNPDHYFKLLCLVPQLPQKFTLGAREVLQLEQKFRDEGSRVGGLGVGVG